MTHEELQELKRLWDYTANEIYYDPLFYGKLRPHIAALLDMATFCMAAQTGQTSISPLPDEPIENL